MCPKDGNGTFQCPHHLIYTFKDYVEGDAWQVHESLHCGLDFVDSWAFCSGDGLLHKTP